MFNRSKRRRPQFPFAGYLNRNLMIRRDEPGCHHKHPLFARERSELGCNVDFENAIERTGVKVGFASKRKSAPC